MSRRKFFKTTFMVEVLSEDESVEKMDIADVIRKMDIGELVGDARVKGVRELSGSEAADALMTHGSVPGFFRLTESGEDVGDENTEQEQEDICPENVGEMQREASGQWKYRVVEMPGNIERVAWQYGSEDFEWTRQELQNRFSVSRVIIIGVIAELKWESDAWRYRIIHQTESLCLRKWSALPAMSKEEACSFIRFNHKVDLIRLVPVGIYVQVS